MNTTFTVRDKETKKEYIVYDIRSLLQNEDGDTEFFIYDSYIEDSRWRWVKANNYIPSKSVL